MDVVIVWVLCFLLPSVVTSVMVHAIARVGKP